MRNINKILSVILTLALLAGSLVMAIPAGAAEGAASLDSFGKAYDRPVVVMGTDANIYTIAADGTTMFMWTKTATSLSKAVGAADTTISVESTEGFPAAGNLTIGVTTAAYTAKTNTTFTITANAFLTPAVATAVNAAAPTVAAALYKSTDAGKTWVTNSSLTVPATGVNLWANVTALKVCPTDVSQLVATDGTSVYRSINGGKNWGSAIAVAGIGATINSIDIAENSDGNINILVGGATGVALFDAAMGSWLNTTAAPLLGVAATWAGAEALAVAFSPDFTNDSQILAVADTGAATFLNNFVIGDTDWNKSIGQGTVFAGASTSAVMAFPTDYTYGSNNQVFVGINGAGGDVYRVLGKFAPTVATVKALGTASNILSLAVDGTKSNSTVIASTPAGIIFSTNADTVSTGIEWTVDDIKSPINGNAVLALASTGILYAGDSGTNSGFYKATEDYMSFNAISRFEVSNIYTSDFSRGVVKDPTTSRSFYFRSVDGNYEMRLWSAGFKVAPTGVRGANVVYAVNNANTKQILKTVDAGLTWTKLSSPGNKSIESMKVVDDNTYWIGYQGAIRSNTGSEILIPDYNELISSIEVVGKTIILGGPNNSGALRVPSTMFYSKDSGATWTRMGDVGRWTTNMARAWKYVASQNTIYVIGAGGTDLYTWNLDTDTSWQKEQALTGIPAADLSSIKTVNAVSDVVFIGISKASPEAVTLRIIPQIYRSMPTTDGSFSFKPYPQSDSISLGGNLDGLNIFDNGDGTFNVKPSLTSWSQPYPQGGIANTELVYTDTTIAPVKLVEPVQNAQINNPVDLKWTAAKTTGTVQYKYEVARDAAFTDVVAGATVTNTNAMNLALTTGEQYYWRVRIEGNSTNNASTLNGYWPDETGMFTVKTIGNVNTDGIGKATSVYPAQGEVGISTTPVLTWGTVADATYNIKIATDSAFTNIVDSKEGLTIALYTPAKTLDTNKTYFWEVQAVSGGVASDWVAFAFTTAVNAVPTGPAVTTAAPTPIITVNVPTQPAITVTQVPVAPSTPAYVWFIIVIGAVLVIAVIVLIVRTRRV